MKLCKKYLNLKHCTVQEYAQTAQSGTKSMIRDIEGFSNKLLLPSSKNCKS